MMDHDEILLRLQETTDRSVRNEGRIKKLETEQSTLHELATSVAALATKQGVMEGDVKEIKTDVKNLSGKSGKRWDAMVDKIAWAIMAAVVAFVLGRIGL